MLVSPSCRSQMFVSFLCPVLGPAVADLYRWYLWGRCLQSVFSQRAWAGAWKKGREREWWEELLPPPLHPGQSWSWLCSCTGCTEILPCPPVCRPRGLLASLGSELQGPSPPFVGSLSPGRYIEFPPSILSLNSFQCTICFLPVS